MAIEYTLYLDTNCALMRLCEIVDGGFDPGPNGWNTFSRPGLWGAISVPCERTRQIVNEDLALDAGVQVYFRLDKFELGLAQDSLVQYMSELLAADHGDAILLFNGETPVLRRLAGDLVLWEGFGVWTPGRLSLLAISYRVGPI